MICPLPRFCPNRIRRLSGRLGLYLSGPHALEPFGGDPVSHDALTTAHNLVKYLGYCGASAVVLPEELADRSTRRALDGQADEDSTGPDRLEIVRRVLSRQGYSLWLELGFDGPGRAAGAASRRFAPRRCGAAWCESIARDGPTGRRTIRSIPRFARP